MKATLQNDSIKLIKELGFEELPTRTEFDRKLITVFNNGFELYGGHSNRYMRFLQQKPELWMFVPAIQKGGDWVVLEKPDSNDDYYRDANGIAYNFHEDMKQYHEALDRVLFDGFVVENSTHHQVRRRILWYRSVSNNFQIWRELIYPSGKIYIYNQNLYTTLEQAVNNGIELKLK